MTKEQKFLLERSINDVVTNPHEKDPSNWIYVSDVLKKYREQTGKHTVDELVGNHIKLAYQIAVQHSRLTESMITQGPCEIAAALDNLEGAISNAREELKLG